MVVGSQCPLSITIPDTWVAPPTNVIKINFDGGVLVEKKGVGSGVVARNSNGSCLGWLSKFFLDIEDPEHAKAIIAREAMELAYRFGWRNIILEGDCAQVISKLQSPDTDSSFIASLISNVKFLCSRFACVSFCQVKRSDNCVAHTLARSAVGSLEGPVDPSMSVLSFLVSDISSDS
ncbi:hypothetical protein BUALT_Bualt12G0131500 [Buddleja alternifolia]|uniref:RNase H type-1 domain-containing protein n=1 Tax=Buddleja alternifolia TaxID=168488 RepID=A0AAV6X1H3_9LAMI|nr:hypothetical protein BUALT_Bualt12G0131500 [Buddleja alternifolia]